MPRIYLYLIFILISCQKRKDDIPKGTDPIDSSLIASNLEEGRRLSQLYCTQCHAYPEPAQLPQSIWKTAVLPKMGNFLGIYQQEDRNSLIEKQEAAEQLILESNVYPKHPNLTAEEWRNLSAFYEMSAPKELSNSRSFKVPLREELFRPLAPKLRIKPPMTTMVKYDENTRLLYHGDVKKDVSTLNIFSKEAELIQAIGLRSPAVQLRVKEGVLWVLTMGRFTSTDAPLGSLVKMSKKNGSKQFNALEIVIDKLQRPVDLAYADFDQDGDEDLVIAQFGNWAGTLEWFENQEENQYERHLLLKKTGACRVLSEDLNGDQKPDILAMIAQGDESIYAFLNQGNGKFETKKLLRVPPSYGSVYFDYVDLDRDGIKDILHVSGDNADYEAILKPYHGLRIFKGKPKLEFEEIKFLPMPGAYKAIPYDFDRDGDLDIASISFFPDYQGEAREGFLMWENISEGDSLGFEAFTIPAYKSGRWIAMDHGDFNQDGKEDLILGSFVVQNPYGDQSGLKQTWMADSPIFLILENNW